MDAIGVANEFIELAKRENRLVRLLGLVKMTYIAHGYSLAANNTPLLDPRYDVVEAWRYGPVIPSVYHTFKHHKSEPIKEKAVYASWNEDGTISEYIAPSVSDCEAKEIIRFVWNRYKHCTESELVTLLHREGTPWSLCYVENMNMQIPDEYTKLFYAKLIMVLKKNDEWIKD